MNNIEETDISKAHPLSTVKIKTQLTKLSETYIYHIIRLVQQNNFYNL